MDDETKIKILRKALVEAELRFRDKDKLWGVGWPDAADDCQKALDSTGK